MSQRDTKYKQHRFEIQCEITRRGHDPPIPGGTFVKCIYDNGVRLYTVIDPLDPTIDEDSMSMFWTTMGSTGVGSIIDSQYHTPRLELARMKIRAPVFDFAGLGRDSPVTIAEPYEDLWYLVAFSAGLYWARFDWLEEITDTSQL